jgi:conjugative transfer signal peptidase TraF
MKKELIITMIVLSVLGITYALSFVFKSNLYVNLSNCEPLGIYTVTPCHHLKIGDMIMIETPKNARPYIYGRGWLPKGWPLLKTVGAVAGDNYRITNKSFYISSKYVGPIFSYDSQGKPLPRLRGQFTVEKGHILPVAPLLKSSFDGRYFGPVPLRSVIGKAKIIIKF